jgi:hypothetical protein
MALLAQLSGRVQAVPRPEQSIDRILIEMHMAGGYCDRHGQGAVR